MTEQQWLECTDPTTMLIHLRQTASSRKCRLLACECCRQHGLFMALTGAKELVDAVELWADQRATKKKISALFAKLELTSPHFESSLEAMRLGFCSEDAYVAAVYTIAWATEDDPDSDSQLTRLIRDLFGNPFHPFQKDPAWITPAVVALASGIYQNNAFHHLHALAHALEQAGCREAELLRHLRDPGPHAKGCWAIDTLLAKT